MTVVPTFYSSCLCHHFRHQQGSCRHTSSEQQGGGASVRSSRRSRARAAARAAALRAARGAPEDEGAVGGAPLEAVPRALRGESPESFLEMDFDPDSGADSDDSGDSGRGADETTDGGPDDLPEAAGGAAALGPDERVLLQEPEPDRDSNSRQNSPENPQHQQLLLPPLQLRLESPSYPQSCGVTSVPLQSPATAADQLMMVRSRSLNSPLLAAASDSAQVWHSLLISYV